ncbi:uncharacterized protein VTP21DRAFT_5568 [Calcarisporiella thermophila]|uniref:uncharacterized protein n=1 Tax=Calcarisporiella thermophila TaxID=911321 RepID=UPI003742A621
MSIKSLRSAIFSISLTPTSSTWSTFLMFIKGYLALFLLGVASLLQLQHVNAQWMPPRPGDSRCPCPAFNTLANHGILPRDGRRVTMLQILQALRTVYGFSTDFDAIATIFPGLYSLANGRVYFNLEDFNAHNLLEHDASLVRQDAFLGDHVHANQTMLNHMLSFSRDGRTLTLLDIARIRRYRERDSMQRNPNYSISPFQTLVALFEAASIPMVFGNGFSVPIQSVRTWLGEERLPDGYKRPLRTLTTVDFLTKAAEIQALRWSPLKKRFSQDFNSTESN